MSRFFVLSSLALLIACNGTPAEDSGTLEDSGSIEGADPDVNNYVPDHFPPTDPTTLIVFGDSISTGVGADVGLSYYELLQQNSDGTYPNHAAIDLETAFPSVTTVINVAERGAVTSDLTAQMNDAESQMTLPVSGPVIIIGTIGGNDLVNVMFGSNRATVVSNINTNVGRLATWANDTSVFAGGGYLYIANVYDPSDGVGSAANCFVGIDTTEAVLALEEANANTRTAAQSSGFAVVDMYGHFMGHGLNYTDTTIAAYDAADPTVWFESDCIHPNTRGHHELRRIFFGAVAAETVPYEVP